MTIREEPPKNYRSRTSEKWKAKEDKIEEAKKQKIKKNDELCQLANIILVMAPTYDLDIFILATVEFGRNA